MNEKASPIDFAMAEHILSQGERYLEAQLQSGIASDQRATTIAAFFGSVAAAMAAAAIAYWDKSGDFAILVSGLVGAILMATGACACLWSARPVNFYFPGNRADSYSDVLSQPLGDVVYGEALNYQDHIDNNDAILHRNGKLVSRGALVATGAPLVAILLWIALSLSVPSFPEGTASDGFRSPSSSDGTSQTSQ